MTWLAETVVTLSAGWLLAIGAAALVVPSRLTSFLRLFASSPRAHFLEQSIRLLAGAAFIALAPEMKFSLVFAVFGWVVAVTSVALMVLPWKWHRGFAQRSIPLVIRHLNLFAVACFALAVFVLVGVSARWA